MNLLMNKISQRDIPFSSKSLSDIFAYVNREFFESKLTIPKLVAVNRKIKDTYASFGYEQDSGLNPAIYVYNSKNRDSFEWIQDLIHEMCHYYMWDKYIKPNLGNPEKMKELNKIVIDHNEEFEKMFRAAVDKIQPNGRWENE